MVRKVESVFVFTYVAAMKIFSLPSQVSALLFDIDNTLYSNDEYYTLQSELLIRRFAEWKDIRIDDALRLIAAEKKRYATENDGEENSIGKTLFALGVSLETSAGWRTELFNPDNYLSSDERTVRTIRELSSRFAVAAVTNNTVEVGKKTLRALDLHTLIPLVVGVDTCFVAKPAADPFEAALRLLDTSPGHAVSIGDRYEVDLRVPLSMGMGGVLIEGLPDVYKLPVILLRD